MNFVPLLFLTSIAWLQLAHSISLDQCTSDTKSQILRLLALLPDRHSPRCSAAAARADYLQVRPAMDLAIEHINSSNLLPCHTLELLYKESGCDEATKTALGLISGLFPSRLSMNKSHSSAFNIVGIIGPTDTLDSMLVSSITNRPDLQIVTLHSAGSSALSNRTIFPNSLGIIGSVQSMVDLSIVLMKKRGWQNVAILYENSSNWFYHILKEQFIASKDNNTRILYISTVMSNFYPIRDITTSKARIVFLFMSPEHSRRIMCLAYHMNLVYPSYQWVLMGQQLSNVVNKCAEVKHQEGKIICSPTVLSNIALKKTFTSDELVNWGYIMYDAVWTWAVGLNKLLTSGENKTFSYTNKQWIKGTMEKFYSVDFQGMSGRISFNASSGFLNRPVNLFFTTGGTENHVAMYTHNGIIVTDSLQNTELEPSPTPLLL